MFHLGKTSGEERWQLSRKTKRLCCLSTFACSLLGKHFQNLGSAQMQFIFNFNNNNKIPSCVWVKIKRILVAFLWAAPITQVMKRWIPAPTNPSKILWSLTVLVYKNVFWFDQILDEAWRMKFTLVQRASARICLHKTGTTFVLFKPYLEGWSRT